MTQEQFVKYAYRHSEVIIFHEKHPEVDVECMLIGVDFDNGLFKLAPFDTYFYEDEWFYAAYDRCDKPKKGRELKVIVNGKTKKIKLNNH